MTLTGEKIAWIDDGPEPALSRLVTRNGPSHVREAMEQSRKENVMFGFAIAMFVIAMIAAFVGFTGLVTIAAGTAKVERSHDLSAEVILAQIRSTVADLLRVTGMGLMESTDALPPLR